MCTGAILLFGIPRVIVGENRNFLGGEDLLRARGVEVTLLDDAACIDMMASFIVADPELWNEDIAR
jgi:cytosine deaminase